MRLEQLHYLLELHKTRSFSKAAENVFITQPSLSTAISSLEEELGIKIFVRTRNGVYPTPIGEEIIKIAGDIVKHEAKLYETAQSNINVPDRLNLITIPAVINGILLQTTTEFGKIHPKASLSIRELSPSTIIGDTLRTLSEEPGTFVICSMSPKTKDAIIDRLQSHHIEATYLYTDQFVCFISRDHPLANQKEISYDDFISQPEIDLNLMEHTPVNDYFFNMARLGLGNRYQKYKVNTMVEVDTLSALKQLVMNNSGVSIMPNLIIYRDRDYEAGNIIVQQFKDDHFAIEYYLLKNNQFPLKPVEKDFINEVVAQFNALQVDGIQ